MEFYSKKVSDIYWYPINFNLVGDKLSVSNSFMVFDNGFNANVYNFLENPKDIKINKKTGMFLTDLLSSKNIFEEKQIQKDITKLTKIETPFKSTDSFVISLSTYQNKKILRKNESKTYSLNDTMKILFETDDIVSIESLDGNYLTYNESNELFFSSKISPPSDTQRFNCLLGNDNIVLFSYDSNFSKIVTISSDSILKLNSVSYNLDATLHSSSIIKFISYENKKTTTDNVKNSYFAIYESSPLLSQKEINPTTNSLNTNYVQNHLVYFPYKNPTYNETQKIAEYKLQIHGLKNYQTSEYNYSRGINYVNGYDMIRRKYNKIFSGTNQEKGLDNLCLGYSTNTYLKTFEPDKYTIFYFPPTTDRISIHNAGLINDGSYAGEIPYVSDRIYQKQISYEELTPGLTQPESIKRTDGTWFCSWLSGNQYGNKIWMDRYYNAAYYKNDSSTGNSDLLYVEKTNPNVEFDVWDEPSTFMFEPGGQYMYFRSGQETSSSFLNYLTADYYNPQGAKLLDISNYNSSPLLDNTPYQNKGILFSTSENDLKDGYLILNGKNHIVFPAKNKLLERDNLTVSIWLNVNDWSDINGNQIIGNYYDSGFGFINESSLTTPIFTLIDVTSGIGFNLNYKLAHLGDITIPPVQNSKNWYIQRLMDLSYWIIDGHNRILRKYNTENKIQKTVDLSNKILSINQVEMDSNENLYFYDIENKKVVKTDTFGNFITSIILTEEYKRIEVDLNDNLVYSYGNASCIDNNNNLWEVIGGNLYKNREVHASLGPIQQIACDGENNIWLVHQKDEITKFNINTDKFEFTINVGKNSLIDQDCFTYTEQFRFLNFIKTPKISKTCIETNDKTEDLTVLIDDSDKLVYLFNSEGSLVSTVNMYSLLTVDLDTVNTTHNFKALGDFTNYQHLRKYARTNKNLSWKFKIATVNGDDGQLYKLTYNTKDLPKGWHHFVFVFNSTKGTAEYYIDTIKVDSVNFQKAKYQLQYDYKSSILVGASNIKNTTLNDLIKIDDAYKLIGEVGQILMYNKGLSEGEISQIYFSSNLSINKSTMKWNIPIGERNYIEEIKHWFQMQLPTNKSKYFNINIHNLDVDEEVKKLIEDSIYSNVKKIAPAHVNLYKINWLNSTREKDKNLEYANMCTT